MVTGITAHCWYQKTIATQTPNTEQVYNQETEHVEGGRERV